MQSLAAFLPMHAVFGAVMRVDVLVAGVPCVVRDVNLTFPSYHRHVHLRDPAGPFTEGPPPNITLVEGDGALSTRVVCC